jgi:hypothetical protein
VSVNLRNSFVVDAVYCLLALSHSETGPVHRKESNQCCQTPTML